MTLTYDLHIHSCLSPCGDHDMTPGNIIGMSMLKGLDVIAVTDHNSCGNCEAAMKIGKDYGITVIPGMELTTLEEVHVVCLFADIKKAMAWDAFVYKQLMEVKNNEEIFGTQLLYNAEDEVIGKKDKLLINAANISFDRVYDLVDSYGGIMIPAHIDKQANSLLSNLGFVPPESKFHIVELKDFSNLHRLQKENPYLLECKVLSDSDAHYLNDISEKGYTLTADSKTPEAVIKSLKNTLSGKEYKNAGVFKKRSL